MSDWRIWLKRKFSGVQGQAARKFKEANAAFAQKNYAAALPLYEESLQQFRQLQQWDMVLPLRLHLGDVNRLAGDYATARTHLEQAISLARNQKHTDYLDAALIRLATVAARQGEVGLAARLCAECLQLEPLPEKALEYAATQCLLAAISKTMSEARTHYETALEIYREHEHREGILDCLCGLGHCTEPGQDNSPQWAWLEECVELCDPHEDETLRSYVLNNLGNIERFEGHLDRALELYRDSLRIKQRLDDEWAIAYSLEGCAAIAAARQEGVLAARLLGKASEIRKRLGTPLERNKQPEYDAVLAQARELLPAVEFEVAWEGGRTLPLSLIVAEVIEE
ncbi:MAG: transcriptional activator domain protein [Chthonomonadales bacterium]|nr:transcriptional activator domain protein [Chthonomonadales bacterium]